MNQHFIAITQVFVVHLLSTFVLYQSSKESFNSQIPNGQNTRSRKKRE
jgi:hypothetical protein